MGLPCATISQRFQRLHISPSTICRWLTFPRLPLAVIAYIFCLAVGARSTFRAWKVIGLTTTVLYSSIQRMRSTDGEHISVRLTPTCLLHSRVLTPVESSPGRQQDARIRSYQAPSQVRTEKLSRMHKPTFRECSSRACPDTPASHNSQATKP
jgi:hypothetical protein